MAVMIPKRPFRSPRRASLLGGTRAVPNRARKTRILPKAVIETGGDQPLLTIAAACLKAIANSQFVLFSFLGGNMFT